MPLPRIAPTRSPARGIHLLGEREALGHRGDSDAVDVVDGGGLGELGERAAPEGGDLGETGRGEVVHLVVEAGDADVGGLQRAQAGGGVDVAVCEGVDSGRGADGGGVLVVSAHDRELTARR